MRKHNPDVENYKVEMEKLLRAGQHIEAGEIGVKIHGLLAEKDLPEFHHWLSLAWKRIKKDKKEAQVARLKDLLELAASEMGPDRVETRKQSFWNRPFLKFIKQRGRIQPIEEK